jgi:hypothetical protein
VKVMSVTVSQNGTGGSSVSGFSEGSCLSHVHEIAQQHAKKRM